MKFIRDLGMRLPSPESPKKYRYSLCECGNCGREFETQHRHYAAGKLKSCRNCSSGMRGPEAYRRTHGLRKHPLYSVWAGMLARCTSDKHEAYRNYGGRGIAVCLEWAFSFQRFYEWSLLAGYKKGLELDRRDNDDGYFPGNCRWIEKVRNVNNTERTRRNNTTGFPGAFKYGNTGRFYSKIYEDGRPVVLGVFATAQEAGEAYKVAKAAKRKRLSI